jgi:hypothetical protein
VILVGIIIDSAGRLVFDKCQPGQCLARLECCLSCRLQSGGTRKKRMSARVDEVVGALLQDQDNAMQDAHASTPQAQNKSMVW